MISSSGLITRDECGEIEYERLMDSNCNEWKWILAQFFDIYLGKYLTYKRPFILFGVGDCVLNNEKKV